MLNIILKIRNPKLDHKVVQNILENSQNNHHFINQQDI